MKKIQKAFLLFLCAIFLAAPISAHSGRTDASGGHKDSKNVSGLGPYHYHHGYEAHLHPGGVCPYDTGVGIANIDDSSSSSSNNYSPSADDTLHITYENGISRGEEIATNVFTPKLQKAEETIQNQRSGICVLVIVAVVAICSAIRSKKKLAKALDEKKKES